MSRRWPIMIRRRLVPHHRLQQREGSHATSPHHVLGRTRGGCGIHFVSFVDETLLLRFRLSLDPCHKGLIFLSNLSAEHIVMDAKSIEITPFAIISLDSVAVTTSLQRRLDSCGILGETIPTYQNCSRESPTILSSMIYILLEMFSIRNYIRYAAGTPIHCALSKPVPRNTTEFIS